MPSHSWTGASPAGPAEAGVPFELLPAEADVTAAPDGGGPVGPGVQVVTRRLGAGVDHAALAALVEVAARRAGNRCSASYSAARDDQPACRRGTT